ncbi:RNA-binding S4 domain-containing protein [Nisaea nitritireducens]|uniref:RNA-binding S4 domain-containing protein n=1 Tax=Nisaea nitritireducens TaxID=568392 RepID=UPI0018666020|nr:RNA-binding S4 domain-containing protein [Nisaea nitritireducens]
MSEDETQRLDKWLWCARFFKSRGLANKMVGAGRLRLSGKVVAKAHQLVRPGDVLTFPQGPHIRVVKVLFLAERRGPAPEAQTLFEDLAPIEAGADKSDRPKADPAPAQRDPGAGRPTKRDRRLIDHLRSADE